MKGNLRLGLVLAAFAAVGCASLAVVYSVTGPAIAMQSEKALQESLQEIFPEAKNFEDVTSSMTADLGAVKIEQAFLVKSELAPIGVAIKAKGSSYGGTARLLVGVGLARDIAGVRVLELNDTPGLGANAKNEAYYVNKETKTTFPGQFKGKYLTDGFEVKKDVVAITAATITSKAIAGIVKTSADAAGAWLEKAAMTSPAADQAQPGAAAPAAEGAAATGGK
jgi:electron transport complex protein RnfG